MSEQKTKDRVISEYGNGTGAMVIRSYFSEDGKLEKQATVHTGTRNPKTNHRPVLNRTNVGDPMKGQSSRGKK